MTEYLKVATRNGDSGYINLANGSTLEVNTYRTGAGGDREFARIIWLPAGGGPTRVVQEGYWSAEEAEEALTAFMDEQESVHELKFPRTEAENAEHETALAEEKRRQEEEAERQNNNDARDTTPAADADFDDVTPAADSLPDPKKGVRK